MSTKVIYSTTSDGYVESGDGSDSEYGGFDGLYSKALYATGSILAAAGSPLGVGQNWVNGDFYSTVTVTQSFVGFDTQFTGVPTISSADIQLTCSYGGAGTFDLQARGLYDWGSAVETGDFVVQSQLSSYTLRCHLSISDGLMAESGYGLTDDSLVASINTFGYSRYILISSNNYTGTQPGGYEYVSFYSADADGTTQDPRLTIEYTSDRVPDGPGPTLDAVIEGSTTVPGDFTASATVKSTQSGSFSADSVSKKTQTGSLTADAYIIATVSGNFSASAVTEATQPSSFTSSAIIKATQSSSFTADSVVRKTQSGSFTADAAAKKTTASSFSADAILAATQSSSFSADAIIQKTQTASGSTFPIVAHLDGGSKGNDVPFTVTFPGGAPSAGELLVVILGENTNPSINPKDGWTELCDAAGTTNDCRLAVLYRVADGTEGTSTQFFSSTEKGGGWTCYVITNYSGVPEISSVSNSGTPIYDPPSLSPSWGSAKTLWLAVMAHDAAIVISGAPENYTDLRPDYWNNLEGAGCASARRELEAASEDPGAFTSGNSEQWAAATVAIKGSAGDLSPFTADASIASTVSGSFSASAVIKATQSSSATADAVLLSTQSNSLTADAEILGVTTQTGDFSTDAVLRSTVASSSSADAVVLGTLPGSFSADSVISVSQSWSFAASAITKRTATGSFSADAVVVKTKTGSLTADSVISETVLESLTADAFVLATRIGSLDADAVVSKEITGDFTADASVSSAVVSFFYADAYLLDPHPEFSFTASAFIQTPTSGFFTVSATIFGTISGSFSADAIALLQRGGSFTASAFIQVLVSGSFTADAVVFAPIGGSLEASAVIKAEGSGSVEASAVLLTTSAFDLTASATVSRTASGSFTADAIASSTQSTSITADAILLAGRTSAFAADAIVSRTSAGSLTADAIIFRSSQSSLTADAILRLAYASSLSASAVVLAARPGSFSADAVIGGSQSYSFSVDAFIKCVGRCIWTTPGDLVSIAESPTLSFLMPDGARGDMRFEINLDTVNSFDSVDLQIILSNSDQTGWEFYDGADWLPMPQTGVPNSYCGNEARFTVQVPLSAEIWYRRVRAGVI